MLESVIERVIIALLFVAVVLLLVAGVRRARRMKPCDCDGCVMMRNPEPSWRQAGWPTDGSPTVRWLKEGEASHAMTTVEHPHKGPHEPPVPPNHHPVA